jgi:hypothetical protein
VGIEEADAVTGIVGARPGVGQLQDGRAPLAEFVERSPRTVSNRLPTGGMNNPQPMDKHLAQRPNPQATGRPLGSNPIIAKVTGLAVGSIPRRLTI